MSSARIFKTFIPSIPNQVSRKTIVDNFNNMKIGKVFYLDKVDKKNTDDSVAFVYLSLYETECAKKWADEVEKNGGSDIVYDKKTGSSWKTYLYLDREHRPMNSKAIMQSKKMKKNKKSKKNVEEFDEEEVIVCTPASPYKRAEPNDEVVYVPPYKRTEPNDEVVYVPPYKRTEPNDDVVYVPPYKRAEPNDTIVYVPPYKRAEPNDEVVYVPPYKRLEPNDDVVYVPPCKRMEDKETQCEYEELSKEIFVEAKKELEKLAFYELWDGICIDFGVIRTNKRNY